MSKKDWYSVKYYYEEDSSRKQPPSFDKMLWLVDEIIESKYSELFFPVLSCGTLVINLSDNWRDNSKLPRIAIYPKWNWFTFHLSHFNEADEYIFDEYKVPIDQSENVRATIFELLERLDNWRKSHGN
ncbi:hypothetical protein BV372_31470 [Nostoc sp. T09]|uniref:hypothetical protein n=1 Tax=Nostoc sp. T09 TaxID=1932621 RepID=UPI000A397FA8|nr:hypothetical protein [Nostoc sp. T09]OUL21700.1 hypothetical protein BV372_31470 [Nostoc sp. T09]